LPQKASATNKALPNRAMRVFLKRPFVCKSFNTAIMVYFSSNGSIG
jgi:hypothetical protein